jgi:hypothetical protein
MWRRYFHRRIWSEYLGTDTLGPFFRRPFFTTPQLVEIAFTYIVISARSDAEDGGDLQSAPLRSATPEENGGVCAELSWKTDVLHVGGK